MNPHLKDLQPYPFEKLGKLLSGLNPPAELQHISLSIGEPKHTTPAFIAEALAANLKGLSVYPSTRGMPELRQGIAEWLVNRCNLPVGAVDPDCHVLPVNGTREALFAFAQTVVDARISPWVVMPNPFYQIYEGAALLAGGRPWFLNTTADNGYQPDFRSVPDAVWADCQLLYICSPGNPSGLLIDAETQRYLIELAERHDFIIASDECYSELYQNENEPPTSLLQTAYNMGNTQFKKCVVFNSLSKRSNVPGLRSGFVAGDADILRQFLLYRTYHGCALSIPVQKASVAAWGDEEHVKLNRTLYRQKFKEVHAILKDQLDLSIPPAGFYFWVKLRGDDQAFTADLFSRKNVTVLPGSYLSREFNGQNPGKNHIRMALVATVDECTTAAHRILDLIST